METTALALKAFALALKASRGFAPPIAMEPYFNPMEMWRRILAMVIYVTKRLTPLVTRLVPPLPLMFNQKSTLQAQLRGIPNEPKDPSDSTSQASWDILDTVEMESSHQREITPESQDMSSGEITPEIYLMMGATVSSSERGPIGSEPQRKNTLLDVPSARKRSMRLLRVDRASAPDQKDRSQGWVQPPLHNQGRNECLQDPKKMPAMPQDHL